MYHSVNVNRYLRMDKLLEEAEKANEVLRFVGAVDVKSGKARAEARINLSDSLGSQGFQVRKIAVQVGSKSRII